PYRIQDIKTMQFAMFPDKVEKGKEIRIDTEFGFAVSNQNDSIRCICRISYLQDENLLMILELHCFFSIAPEAMAQLEQEKKVPVYFLQYMGTIVVGTARGVLHARTENTDLNRFILPPINLVDIIKDDLIMK
ncbi:MAG: hypothetical protein K6F89_02575, partial [Prevotella sp.]|nr:hypothetical protein [Prevotella sp.]